MMNLSLMLVTLCSFGGKPPVLVQKAFQQKFPGSTHVTWRKETNALWEAFFTLDGIKRAADFSIAGTWLETETEVKRSDLPAAAQATLSAQFHGWTLIAANKVENASHLIVYVTDISRYTITKVVAFKEDGATITR